MKPAIVLKGLIAVATVFALMSCTKDPNVPATAEDQARMMRGHAPTPDQLDKAMKEYRGLSMPGGSGLATKPKVAPKR